VYSTITQRRTKIMEITVKFFASEIQEAITFLTQIKDNGGDHVLENIPVPAPVGVPDIPTPVAGYNNPAPCDMGSNGVDLTNPDNWVKGNLQVGPSILVPSTVTGVERDRRGLPWDGRIHASSRAKVADGTWRMRRNVSDDVIMKVEAELRAKWCMPPLPVDERQIISQDDNCLPPHMAFNPPLSLEELPPAPPVEELPPAPPVNPDDVKNLILESTRRGLSPEVVSDACNKVGIPGLPGLINRPEMARAVAMILGVTI
jgi:hypothetical protein